MEICFQVGGTRHCYYLPIVEFPVKWGHVPKPNNYPALVQDAIILASMQNVVKQLGDGPVRAAVATGISSAWKALQAHAGSEIKISAEQAG